MKLLIISALVAIATAVSVSDVNIESIVLPRAAIPKVETPYVPSPEPISLGVLIVPPEVINAVKAEEVEPVQVVDLPVESIKAEHFDAAVDNIQIEPIKIVNLPAYEPISAGELETLRIKVPEVYEPVNADVEPVRVVDSPIEVDQKLQEDVMEPVRFVDAPQSDLWIKYPHLRFPNPYWR